MADTNRRTVIALLAAVVVLLAIVVVLLRQGGSETRVALDASGTVENNVLTVRGTATVPDGALLAYLVDNRSDGATGGQSDASEHVIAVAEVRDQAFAFDVPVGSWPGDSVHVAIAFLMRFTLEAGAASVEQPAHVLALYGEQGERMEGDVTVEGDSKWVEIEFTVAR